MFVGLVDQLTATHLLILEFATLFDEICDQGNGRRSGRTYRRTGVPATEVDAGVRETAIQARYSELERHLLNGPEAQVERNRTVGAHLLLLGLVRVAPNVAGTSDRQFEYDIPTDMGARIWQFLVGA